MLLTDKRIFARAYFSLKIIFGLFLKKRPILLAKWNKMVYIGI